MYRLVYLTGELKGKRLAITEDKVSAGREPDCAIQIPDDEASRKHALFEKRDDGIYIKDLGSTNELLVNGQIVDEALLQHGDKIEFGKTVIQFQGIVHAESIKTRRTSKTQAITAAAVFVIIAGQVLFLLFLAIRHKDVLSVPEKDPSPPPIEDLPLTVDVPIPDESVTLAEAEAHLKEMERRQAEIEEEKKEEEAKEKETPPPEEEPEAPPEIRELKSEVAELRQQVEDLVVLEPAGEDEDAAEDETETDPLLRRAREMLKEAANEIARSNYINADRELARIQLMAPDFIPAYIERARLFERRGMLQQAGEQWSEVLNRSMGTPLYEEAAAERIRLAREQVTRKTVTPERDRSAKPSGRLPRRIRIDEIQQERFPENDQFEEMRLLRITLKPKPGERNIDSYNTEVVATFFDENVESHEIVPTRAVVPKDSLRVDGEWRPNQEKVVTAAFIVPQGFRAEEQESYNQRMLYYGYVVQVYYRGELQDVEVRPKDLLTKLDDIPSPFHAPKKKTR